MESYQWTGTTTLSNRCQLLLVPRGKSVLTTNNNMASLSLPAPTRAVPAPTTKAIPPTKRSLPVAKQSLSQPQAPSYEERCHSAALAAKLTPEQRKAKKVALFVPRKLQDFDGGGSFPEIHVAQYPRHMGNPHLKKRNNSNSNSKPAQGTISSSRAIVNVEVDAQGEVSYDAIVKGGTNSDKIVYTSLSDIKGVGEAKEEDVALPSADEEAETAQKTQAALQSLVSTKIAMDRPTGSAMIQAETSKDQEAKTQFIKYTPSADVPGYNPAAKTRVIQMVPKQLDPMMPPKHKHVKAPRGPADDPVPVLHAPNTKLTKEEKAAWNIPACISNWKNTRGYTIPLDKRLAADGRHLREHTINNNFATLSESLYVAERQARQEVRMRSQVQKKLVLSEKEQREEQLRRLANEARLERSGVAPPQPPQQQNRQDHNDDKHDNNGMAPAVETISDRDDSGDDNNDANETETDEQVAARQRERLRLERKRERERDLRMENNMALKKQKMEAERDVSEKIALGQLTGQGGGAGGEVDSRLYNQSAGMDSGFGAEDEYNTYSKPLFGTSAGSASIYRPSRGEEGGDADDQYDKLVEGSTGKFAPDKGFAGADSGGSGAEAVRAGPRSAPVQFEKSKGN